MQHMSMRTHHGPPTVGDTLTALYAAVIVTSGIYGLVHPALSIESGLGVASVVYSLGLIVMGAIVIASVAWAWRRTELVALLTLAALTALHSVLVAVSSGTSGGQTALRLAAAVVGLTGWALCRWDRGITRRQVDRHINHALGDRPNV
jgi:hypothetical protein